MIKKMKKFRINVLATISYPVYVIAENEAEAIRQCEQDIDDGNFESFSDTVGFNEPYDPMDDVDSTERYESIPYGAGLWELAGFQIDDEEPEEVELDFEEDEEEEDV